MYLCYRYLYGDSMCIFMDNSNAWFKQSVNFSLYDYNFFIYVVSHNLVFNMMVPKSCGSHTGICVGFSVTFFGLKFFKFLCYY